MDQEDYEFCLKRSVIFAILVALLSSLIAVLEALSGLCYPRGSTQLTDRCAIPEPVQRIRKRYEGIPEPNQKDQEE